MTKTSISIIFNITWLFSCLWMIAIMGISVAVIFKHSLVDSWHTGSTFWLLTKDLRFKPWFGPHKYSKSRSTHQRSSLDISADDIELFECADEDYPLRSLILANSKVSLAPTSDMREAIV